MYVVECVCRKGPITADRHSFYSKRMAEEYKRLREEQKCICDITTTKNILEDDGL